MEWFLLFCSVYFASFLIKISRSVRKLLSALVFRTIIWIFTKSIDFCFTETNVFDELVGSSLLPSIGEIGLQSKQKIEQNFYSQKTKSLAHACAWSGLI